MKPRIVAWFFNGLKVKNMLNIKQNIIWMAGFFDGEGCITFTKRYHTNKAGVEKCYRGLIVSVSQVELEPIKIFSDYFTGGYRYHWLNKNNRKQHEFRASGKNAIGLLKILLPYLVVKKSQAELALSYKTSNDLEKELIIKNMSEIKKGTYKP